MPRTAGQPGIPIIEIRDRGVILDVDLALLYGVETKVLNQAVKRNADRFPDDFVFQLTAEEFAALKSQIVTSKGQVRRPASHPVEGGERFFSSSSVLRCTRSKSGRRTVSSNGSSNFPLTNPKAGLMFKRTYKSTN